MTENTVVSVRNITKAYKLYESHADRVKETFHPFRKKYHHTFHALKDVSFEVEEGEAFGIIGRNGSGKSTLLQIICGILRPTSGSVDVSGRISALLELGTGFNPEFTGRENVYLSGAILGFGREQMNERFDEIAAFADIGEFIDQPVKTYSTGMYVRLAFAVQVCVDPALLIVDEALSVGDIFFIQKCFKRIRKILKTGTTLLFVTHDMNAASNLCSKAIWIHEGSIRMMGDPNRCIKEYLGFSNVGSNNTSLSAQVILDNSSGAKITEESLSFANKDRFGNQLAKISKAWLVDDRNRPIKSTEHGQFIKVILETETNTLVKALSAGIELSDRMGQVIFATGLRSTGKLIPKSEPGKKFIVIIRFQVLLAPGEYTIDVGCGGLCEKGDAWDRVLCCAVITVINTNDRPIIGIVSLPHDITILDSE